MDDPAMTSPDTLAQTIRDAMGEASRLGRDFEPHYRRSLAALDSLLALLAERERERDGAVQDAARLYERAIGFRAERDAVVREAATLREIAEKFVAAYPGNTVAQLGNGAARRAHGEFAAALAAAAPAQERRCPNCNGGGKVRDSMLPYPVVCGRCDGRGKIAAAAHAETAR